MSDESEHSGSEFYYPGELSNVELLQSPTSLRKHRKKVNTSHKWKSSRLFLRSQQANGRSRKQLFRKNCPIINLWNKQTVLRWKFIVGQKQENLQHEENKVRYKLKCFLRFSRVSGKLVKLEKSQTYLVYSRINCSLVSTQCCLKRQNWVRAQVHYRTVHPHNKTGSISVKRDANFCHSLSWWFRHIFDSFMSTFCWLFSMNCNCRLPVKNKDESCFSMNCEFLARREELNDKFLL